MGVEVSTVQDLNSCKKYLHDDYSKGFSTENQRKLIESHQVTWECGKYTFCTPPIPPDYMSNNSRRLSILSAKEVDDLYGLPHFTEDEQHLYFGLSTAERQVVEKVRTV